MNTIEQLEQQQVYQTSTGNFTYKQYVFIPLDIENTKFTFCGKDFDSIESVKTEIDTIVARKGA